MKLIKKNNHLESKAFDLQIENRIKNGHKPDLRFKKKVKYFFNNVWRDPYLIQHTFLYTAKFFHKRLLKSSKVLEVGCGPGHLSLELARLGHTVTGLDISRKCIDIANKTAQINDRNLVNKGKLAYRCIDFSNPISEKKKYDVIIFAGALSHFPNLKIVKKNIDKILKKNGIICVWDTCVKQYTVNDASIFGILRTLLSAGKFYYEQLDLPNSEVKIESYNHNLLNELMYVNKKGKKKQSPNDNSQDFRKMMNFLNSNFKKIDFEWESSFSRMLVGGIRHKNRNKEKELINYIWKLEKVLINQKLINPAFFHWIGKKNK